MVFLRSSVIFLADFLEDLGLDVVKTSLQHADLLFEKLESIPGP